MRTKLLSIALLCMALNAPAQALDISGINFAEHAPLAGSDLVLNGAGLRIKLFFKIYAIGLYLPQKADNAEAILNTKGPRRIQIITLRDLSGEQLTDALLDALTTNHSEAEMNKLAARVAQFRSTMLAIAKVPEKTVIRLDYLPPSGTRLTVGTEQKGADIAGQDFYQALLRIWLGNAPVQADIKGKLSGKP